jgi:hypothetical protein
VEYRLLLIKKKSMMRARTDQRSVRWTFAQQQQPAANRGTSASSNPNERPPDA